MAAHSTTGILSGIFSGLNNTYAYIKSQSENGVTYDSITSLQNDNNKSYLLNNTFASFLQGNFTTIDKDGDGIIGDDEISTLTNNMARSGLSKEEFIQMYSSGTSGISQSTAEMIIQHFDEIDTNKDGRVTSAEISAFSVNSVKQERLDEETHRRATNMSVFYGDDSSSGGSGAYSLLSYRYKTTKSS